MGEIVRLVIVAAVVYAAYNYVRRLLVPNSGPQPGPRTTPAGPVRDLAPCPVCGTYISADADACDRPECPKGRRRA